jgi:hypothetical protein
VICGTTFVFAIEGKFGADFQPRQLERYQSWLTAQQKDHKLLIVITPKSHQGHAKDQALASNATVVDWESLVEHVCRDLIKTEAVDSLSDHLVVEWLSFVKTLCVTYKWEDLPENWPILTQKEMLAFLNAAHPLFSDTRYELCEKNFGGSAQKLSYGYSVLERRHGNSCNAWFGFVNTSEFSGNLEDVVDGERMLLTLATDISFHQNGNFIQIVAFNLAQRFEVKHRHFENTRSWQIYPNCVTIRPLKGGEPSGIEDWRKLLEPFRDAVARMHGRG